MIKMKLFEQKHCFCSQAEIFPWYVEYRNNGCLFCWNIEQCLAKKKTKIRFLSIVRSTLNLLTCWNRCVSLNMLDHPHAILIIIKGRPISDWYTTNHCSVLCSLCAFRPLHARKIFEILDKHCLEIHCLCRQVIVNSTGAPNGNFRENICSEDDSELEFSEHLL